MPFLLLLLITLIGALLFLLWPLLRLRQVTPRSRARLVDQQIARIEQDVALGKLRADDAAETRLRLERQLLDEIAAEEQLSRAGALPPLSAAARGGLAAVILLAVGGSAALYLTSYGNPGVPGQPLAQRQDTDLPEATSDDERALFQAAVMEARATGSSEFLDGLRRQIEQRTAGMPSAEAQAEMAALSPEQRQARIESMVAGLADRLASEPDDLAGWRQLARAAEVLGDGEKATTALRAIVRLDPADLGARDRLARMLMAAVPPGGAIPAEAAEQFNQLFAANPANVEAAFFAGISALQQGDRARAEQLLSAALAALPEDSPARAEIAREVDRLLGRQP